VAWTQVSGTLLQLKRCGNRASKTAESMPNSSAREFFDLG
jgi:hypothetical protein